MSASQEAESTLPEPTLKDIAEASGLSVAAVSKVLNNREGVSNGKRELVTRIARELGYKGRSGRLPAIRRIESAVLVTLDKYVTKDVFYGEILDGLFASARDEGIAIRLAIVTSNDPASADFDALREMEGDATILVGLDEEPVIEAIRQAGRPAVLVNGMDRKMQLSSVSPDYNFGGWAATRHLLDLGHREIVHATHIYRESLKRRLLGFRDALEEAGIAYSPEQHVLDVGSPDMLTLSCSDTVARWLKSRTPRPTAVFCTNDMVALGVLKAAAMLGLDVPRDLSIIGFDGLSLGAHANPPLTTMQMDRRDMARVAIELLVGQASGGFASARRMTLGVELIDRHSTGPAP
ncbi:LacI family transcriptional regulator [Martelella alba]|uniref:LacI family transcriptional regulator n=1 Tax=Martelella alba TaxID=2590451 RepID=A0A506U6X6_9HYPH|nr:LacI family DNA-binding transcriptional regulator [Martelella alba]TPW27647.1 LacI family transcriptional regulator [Martelella alba]